MNCHVRSLINYQTDTCSTQQNQPVYTMLLAAKRVTLLCAEKVIPLLWVSAAAALKRNCPCEIWQLNWQQAKHLIHVCMLIMGCLLFYVCLGLHQRWRCNAIFLHVKGQLFCSLECNNISCLFIQDCSETIFVRASSSSGFSCDLSVKLPFYLTLPSPFLHAFTSHCLPWLWPPVSRLCHLFAVSSFVSPPCCQYCLLYPAVSLPSSFISLLFLGSCIILLCQCFWLFLPWSPAFVFQTAKHVLKTFFFFFFLHLTRSMNAFVWWHHSKNKSSALV